MKRHDKTEVKKALTFDEVAVLCHERLLLLLHRIEFLDFARMLQDSEHTRAEGQVDNHDDKADEEPRTAGEAIGTLIIISPPTSVLI